MNLTTSIINTNTIIAMEVHKTYFSYKFLIFQRYWDRFGFSDDRIPNPSSVCL